MKKVLLALSVLAIIIAGCKEPESSDNLQNRKQEEMNKQAVQSVGMPAIVNFQEKRMLKDILELRDTAIKTYTYTISEMTGQRRFLCNSIGFALSSATQYTNPQKISEASQSGYAILPQADPNGLYSPTSAEGSYVMCINPENGKIVAMYVEPRVIVSQFKLEP
jgi:hypothetical protein